MKSRLHLSSSFPLSKGTYAFYLLTIMIHLPSYGRPQQHIIRHRLQVFNGNFRHHLYSYQIPRHAYNNNYIGC